VPLAVIGGGTPLIEAVPWALAQLPYVDRSTAIGGLLLRQLGAHGVPLFRTAPATLPLRGLVGTNMPAVLIEMGFLTNPDDERALTGSDRSAAIIDSIVATIAEIRRRLPPPGSDRGGR